MSRIGFVFVEGFADWEFGLLSGSAVEWFGAEAVAISPDGAPVRSMAGFRLMPDRSAEPARNGDLQAVAVIGSDLWASERAPDIAPLLTMVAGAGGLVGGICAGTLAVARAGLLEDADHTSNGPEWIRHHLPDYPGSRRYRDVPHAVRDGRIITAPGSAPGTFALAFLEALFPEKASQRPEMRSLFAREYGT